MKFEVITADPAWSFSDRLQKMKAQTKRSAQSQYRVMTVDEIARLDVKSLANPDHCVLALWTPSTLLAHGLKVMSAWGFSFKQTFVWVKTKKDITKHAKKMIDKNDVIDMNDMMAFGMGRLFRQAHELALIGTMGKVYPFLDSKSERSVLFDINGGHSKKPEGLQDRLEAMFPDSNKLELFARRTRPNWTTLGDAVTGKDIIESIQELLSKV